MFLKNDSCKVSILVLLDRTADFDIVITLYLLRSLVLFCPGSSPTCKTEVTLQISNFTSKQVSMICGVPQGRVLTPFYLIFPYYMEITIYADDSQLFISLLQHNYVPIYTTLCHNTIVHYSTGVV